MSQVVAVEKDDKRIITEMAFGVEPTLLGTKLASPFQRGVAILVDAFLVLLLTDVSGVFWGLLVGLAFFKAGRKQKNKKWRLTRFFVRLVGAMVIFISVVVFYEGNTARDDFEPILEMAVDSNGVLAGSGTSLAQLAAYGSLTAEIVKFSSQFESKPDCQLGCARDKVKLFLSQLESLDIPNDQAIEIVAGALPDRLFESEQVKVEFLAEFETAKERSAVNALSNIQTEASQPTSEEAVNPEKQTAKPHTKDKPVYSLVEYVKALIADLGLGFGWAALYFTAFSAWWRGQTPGKKLMGIRIVQLDGTYMSAWEAFGRYGGYGAGFATGLMGFLQILWDPNRQAIQDKISATVVIQGDLRQKIPENELN